MPKEARIAIFDDDSSKIKALTWLLEDEGHTIAAVAKTRQEVEEAISLFEQNRVDIVLVDGNLTEDDRSGEDGKWMAGLVRKKSGIVKTIGISASGKVEGVDLNFNIWKQNPPDFIRMVEEA